MVDGPAARMRAAEVARAKSSTHERSRGLRRALEEGATARNGSLRGPIPPEISQDLALEIDMENIGRDQ